MEHLEGRQSVLAALAARQRRIQVVLLRQGIHPQRAQEIVSLAEACGVAIRYANEAELDALAHGASHGGVVAVCSPKPRTSPDELFAALDRLRSPPLLLLLEGVDDARNLGFTLRTADALGVHAVLIKKHLWDFDAVEIARPASGAYERLPLVQIDDTAPLRELARRGVRIHGCVASAKRAIYDVDLVGPALLVIGGEKRGISGAVRELCDALVTIPTRGEPSSLALAHAAAIAVAEAARQRRVQASAG